jgi:hypothetical protein
MKITIIKPAPLDFIEDGFDTAMDYDDTFL